MKIIFISHPIAGAVEANLADIRRIVRKINTEHTDLVPFVPYYVDVVCCDDKIPHERNRAIRNIIAVFHSGCIDEVWLCGPRISPGMKEEKILAEACGIRVVNKIKKL